MAVCAAQPGFDCIGCALAAAGRALCSAQGLVDGAGRIADGSGGAGRQRRSGRLHPRADAHRAWAVSRCTENPDIHLSGVHLVPGDEPADGRGDVYRRLGVRYDGAGVQATGEA
ncbi:hypothetical protein D3C77_506660 [compost metagenome]